MNPFQRWLLTKFLASFVNHELSAFTEGVYEQSGAGVEATVGVQRCALIFERSQTGATLDHMQCGLHFVNTAGELIGSDADDTQKLAMETAWLTFWNAAKTRAGTNVRFEQFRWYHQTLDDPLSGVPTRITQAAAGLTGTASPGPPQVCSTVTLRTALRKHWGRIYLPCSKFDSTNGQLAVSDFDAIATAFRTFVNACATVELMPVVYSKIRQAVFSVAAVEVDSVLDVQRRRRPPVTGYKNVLT